MTAEGKEIQKYVYKELSKVCGGQTQPSRHINSLDGEKVILTPDELAEQSGKDTRFMTDGVMWWSEGDWPPETPIFACLVPS